MARSSIRCSIGIHSWKFIRPTKHNITRSGFWERIPAMRQCTRCGTIQQLNLVNDKEVWQSPF